MVTTKTSCYVFPEWPAPAHVHAVVTTRQCGNLALHVNDDPAVVMANRQRLRQNLALPHEPVWLDQVHSADTINVDCAQTNLQGDAAYSETAQKVCAILTADCLPLLVTNRQGSKIAAIHAGWRGLVGGVIDATLRALKIPGADCLVWLGPAIGPDHFEVGAEVREQFIIRNPDYAAAFKAIKHDKWLADIYHLAKINLRQLGINQVFGGGLCTYCNPQFYSYRREHGVAGRMASLIWCHSNK